MRVLQVAALAEEQLVGQAAGIAELVLGWGRVRHEARGGELDVTIT
jgi:hypothetical protein